MSLFALTLLVQSFLLMAILPISLKFLFPQTLDHVTRWLSIPVALGIFQSLGLVYGLVLAKYCSLKTQTYSQLILWSISFSFCFLFWPGGFGGQESPLAFLLTTGLIFFAGCASEFLLIHGYSQTTLPGARDPYFLLSTASLGALLAMVGYPFLIEHFPLMRQVALWRWAYGGVGVMLIACGLIALRSAAEPNLDSVDEGEAVATDRRPTLIQGLHWLILSAATSLFVGGIGYISAEVSPWPLIWLSYGSVFLFALTAAFARPSAALGAMGFAIAVKAVAGLLTLAGVFYFQWLVSPSLDWIFYATAGLAAVFMFLPYRFVLLLQPPAVLVAFFVLIADLQGFNLWLVVYLHLLTYLLVAWVCFGEQAATRPAGEYFPEFAFWMALGGFVGFAFNSWLAPRLFDSMLEYPLALMLACMLRPNQMSAGLVDRLVFRWFGTNWSDKRRRFWTVSLDFLAPIMIGAFAILYFSQMNGKLTSWMAAIPLLICLATVGRPVRFGLSLGCVYLAHCWLVAASRELDGRGYFP